MNNMYLLSLYLSPAMLLTIANHQTLAESHLKNKTIMLR